MKSEIIEVMGNIVAALNKVQVMPGKENWLNQGGAIAMLEDISHQIDMQLMDKPVEPDRKDEAE